MATSLNQPQAISQPFAQNGDKNIIPVTNDGTTGAASESLGFPQITSVPVAQGGIPPARKDFNGIFNVLSNQYFYLQNGGSFTFNQDVSDAIGGYPVNAILRYTDNDVSYQVRSLIPNNTYNFVTTPSYIDGVHWEKAFSEDLSNYVSKTGSNTISANNTFSGTNTFSGSTSLSTNTTGVTQAINDASTKIATTQFVQNVAVTKANKDMDNLTSTGQNIANWSNNVTNCITEIPQDIKLELNNGTLTLKAGSKVYIPNEFEQNGTTPKFDTVTVTSDITNTTTGAGEKMFLSVYNNGTTILFAGYTTGGTVTERPVSPTLYALYYNTTTNKVEFYNGSAWVSDCSFPFALYTRGSAGATSIDQVFNGFGYIGSTVFALPGVKGLAPNGFNTGGTLKNNIISDSSVRIYTLLGSYNFALAKTKSAIGAYYYAYNPKTNKIYRTDTGAEYGGDRFIFGKCTTENGRITSFSVKTAFHAVDYNDFSDLKDTVDTKANDSDVVKLTGNQTIAGIKTFTGGTNSLRISRGTSSFTEVMTVKGDNTTRTGGFRNINDNNNTTLMYVASDDGTSIAGTISIIKPSSGSVYTQAPTPATSDNSTKIATTAYCNNKHQLVSALPASPSADVFYYIPEN